MYCVLIPSPSAYFATEGAPTVKFTRRKFPRKIDYEPLLDEAEDSIYSRVTQRDEQRPTLPEKSQRGHTFYGAIMATLRKWNKLVKTAGNRRVFAIVIAIL